MARQKSMNNKQMLPPKEDITVSYALTLKGFNIAEEVVDRIRKKMRGQPVKFQKRYVYEALMVKGAEHFDDDDFIVNFIHTNHKGE